MKENEAHELAHLYVDGALSRREMIRRSRNVAGGVAAISSALNLMGVPLNAQTTQCPENVRVPADAEDIVAQMVEFPGEASPVFGYFVKPKREAVDPLPTVLVVHENRGMNEHIQDVARRMARSGFNALAIDLLSRQGGTALFPDPADAGRAYNMTTVAGRLADLRSAVTYLKSLPDVLPKVGAVGFCAGGGNVWNLSASGEEMGAYVVYYGAPVIAVDQVEKVNAPVLCHYAELDRNLTIGASAVIGPMITARKTLGFFVHEGVGHAFNNDTGAAYNRAAACDAWAKTLDFFTRHLNPPPQ